MNEQQLHQSAKQKQQLFFHRKEKEKERRKKDMPFKQPVKRRLSRFFGKILPEAERRCGDFGENPEGLTLY